MTNLEWLHSLEPKELSEWFAAEHADVRTCKRVATAAKILVDPYGLNLKTRHICSECRTEILPWFRYCEFCGAKVVSE